MEKTRAKVIDLTETSNQNDSPQFSGWINRHQQAVIVRNPCVVGSGYVDFTKVGQGEVIS